MPTTRIIFSALAPLIAAASAQAVEVERTGEGIGAEGCTMRLTGPIEAGDAARVNAEIERDVALVDNYPSPVEEEQYVVCLAGPGGNYMEGLRLAQVLSEHDVTTKVEADATCLSACALAFMGGRLNTRSGEGWRPSRIVEAGATLGFHAPSLGLAPGTFDERAIEDAFGLALDAITELNRLSGDLFLPTAFVERVIAHRGNDFFYVDRVDDLLEYDIALAQVPSVPMDRTALRAACLNAFYGQERDHACLADEEWDYVLGDEYVYPMFDLAEREGQPVFTFSPFDGFVHCQASRPSTAPAIYPVWIVMSEWQDFSDPLIERYDTELLLLPGNTRLSTLR